MINSTTHWLNIPVSTPKGFLTCPQTFGKRERGKSEREREKENSERKREEKLRAILIM